MLQSIGMWLVKAILEWLYSLLTKQIATAYIKYTDEKVMAANNEKAVKKYNEAKDRHEKVKSALSILNRTAPVD